MTKHQKIYDRLAREIATGRLKKGDRTPSEAALMQRFSVSRITASRALNDLENRQLVKRIAGSGTYVTAESPGAQGGLLFGLVIPQLGETEIFEPICHGIANSPLASRHALLWPQANMKSGSVKDQALQLCRQCIERRVAGVFFAPLERTEGGEAMNARLLAILKRARVPVVLLDRRPSLPAAMRPDLVGIDNQRAGFLATEHLLRVGARRIGFVSYSDSASTIKARRAGYREALASFGVDADPDLIWKSRAEQADFAAAVRNLKIQGFVCGNDRMAGELMHRLLAENIRIPADVRIVGIDDVHYASLLPVPLSTIHQACREIGEMALSVMMERITRPKLPARDVLLDCYLVTRDSCGSAREGRPAS